MLLNERTRNRGLDVNLCRHLRRFIILRYDRIRRLDSGAIDVRVYFGLVAIDCLGLVI